MNYSKYTKEELITIIEQLKNENQDKSRDLFLSNISHDVRTLLNAIYGNAQILNSDDSLEKHQKKSVTRIIEASSHMIDLINNIITISQNSGNDKVVLSEFNLLELLNNIYSIFKNVSSSKGIAFELNTNIDESFIIKTDKNKLFYILLNLLGNAFKYTSKGSVFINCNLLENKNKLLFEIIDTGLGIENSVIENIKQEYARGENSVGTQGFGLGLGIVSKNLDLLSSILDVKSVINKGSTFSFTIKCQKKSKTFVSTQDDIFEINEIESIQEPNDFLVLIYANNEEELPILNSYFKSRNIRYKIVNNIEKLRLKIESNKVEMIFIDLSKLEKAELDFFKELKTLNRKLSLVTLTSSVMSEDLVKINEISTTYIIEPYSFIDIDQSLIMFSNQKFNYVEKKDNIKNHELIIVNNNFKEDIIKESKFGNYKSCLDLINLIEDEPSKSVLLEYLENYDFDRIIEILTNVNE